MSKVRDISGLANIIKTDANGNVTFVSGSTTLVTINTSGQLSGSSPVLSSSYALNATSASYALSASNATNAVTASFANAFTVANTLTATTLVVQTVSSSVIYSSGSNVFGNNIANTQVMTGSVTVTGSLAVITNGTEFQVNASGVKIGNVSTDSHTVTGSVSISGSSTTIGTASFQTSGNNGVINLGGNTYYGQVKVDSNLGGIQINSIWGGANSGIIQLTNGTAGNVRLHIADNGNIGIGTPTPVSTQGGLDISSGGLSLILGADSGAATRTNATGKVARIASYQYTNANTPSAMVVAVNDGTDNSLWLGGGSGLLNAATQIQFYTAANNNTLTGTVRMAISSSGDVFFGTGMKISQVGSNTLGALTSNLILYSTGYNVYIRPATGYEAIIDSGNGLNVTGKTYSKSGGGNINPSFTTLFTMEGFSTYIITMHTGTGDGTYGIHTAIYDSADLVTAVLSGNNISSQISGTDFQIKSNNGATYGLTWTALRIK